MTSKLPSSPSAPGPLSGLRVLDIASLYAAPFAASILGDFGAEVIKVEPPGTGDGFRNTGMWPVVARNKKSITLDLRQPEGCEVFKQLVARSDVVVENYPRAVLERRGIAWEQLSKVNPDLVMVSISCYGQTGPYADRPGSGTIGEGFGGMVNMIGEADGPPLLPSFPLGDAIGAMSSVIGTMMALYWRDSRRARPASATEPRGQHVDASLFEPVLLAISQVMSRWQPDAAPRRSGSRLATSAIRNVFRCQDGRFVVISASTERHVLDLVKLAGGSPAQATLHDAEPVVVRWIATQPQSDLLRQLVAARIPVAPVNDIDALLTDPHIAARQSVVRVDDAQLGPLALVQPVPRLSASPGAIRTVGPALGEHNEEVFGQLLGLEPARWRAVSEAAR